MRCSKCGGDNREGRKFCTNCGTSLTAACPRCGAPIQTDEKFCGECGAEIGTSRPLAPSSARQTPVQLSDAVPATIIEGERKTVTALFADIKGSMELVFLRGWATAATSRFEEGITEMQRSIADPAFSQSVAAALARVALAETCGNNGRAEQGLDFLEQGLAAAKQIGQTIAEAELHRVKGELMMIKGAANQAEAERCLRTAIDIARRQSAKLFELRATVSLSRLLCTINRADEARTMLSKIYDWFTEGFDTRDLQEANQLLNGLNQES